MRHCERDRIVGIEVCAVFEQGREFVCGEGLAQPPLEALVHGERRLPFADRIASRFVDQFAVEDRRLFAKGGDNLTMEFLLNKYKNFVRIKAKSFFLIGADREDIIQEGMIGLSALLRGLHRSPSR